MVEMINCRTSFEVNGTLKHGKKKIALIILEEEGLPKKHPSVGMTTGEVFMCLSIFAKRKTWTERIHFILGFLHLNLVIIMAQFL